LTYFTVYNSSTLLTRCSVSAIKGGHGMYIRSENLKVEWDVVIKIISMEKDIYYTRVVSLKYWKI